MDIDPTQVVFNPPPHAHDHAHQYLSIHDLLVQLEWTFSSKINSSFYVSGRSAVNVSAGGK